MKKAPKRKSKAKTDHAINIRCPVDVLAKLDKWAKKNGYESRSVAIRHLLGQALDEYELAGDHLELAERVARLEARVDQLSEKG